MKLKAKFAFGVSTLVLAVVAGGAVLTVVAERRLLKEQIHQHNQTLIQRLAKVTEESLYQNEVGLFNYLKTLRDERGFVGAAFVDSQGIIQMDSEPKKIGQPFSPPKNDALLLSAPVFYASNQVGQVHLALSQSEIQKFLNESMKNTLRRSAVVSGISLLIGLLGAALLAGHLINPIQKIIEGMRRMATGDLAPIVFSRRRDEIGWMGQELNHTIMRLRELDEMKRDFVAGVTHELRSPLSGTDQLLTRLLKGSYGTMTGEQKDLIALIQNNLSRLSTNIDDLLITAKLEAGRMELDRENFDLKSLIQEVATLYKPMAEEKGLTFKLDVPNAPLPVQADREKIGRVLTNLIANALKFTKEGGVVVGALKNGAPVTVYVEDSGPGIPPAEREKIFEKFYRTAEAKNVKGTGLGLSIAKGIIEAHGGTLTVGPATKRGARFSFTLPNPTR